MNRYVHQLAEWPDFTWDCEAIAEPLLDVRHRQGYWGVWRRSGSCYGGRRNWKR